MDVEKIGKRVEVLRQKKSQLAALQSRLESIEKARHGHTTRREENQLKFAVGGLAKIAGLLNWDRGQLLGGLLALASIEDAEKLARMKRVGDAELAARWNKKSPE